MKKFKNFTLQEYTQVLAEKKPTPGGGSATALSAALGVGLIEMVANYSKGRGRGLRIEQRFDRILAKGGDIRKRLLELVDLDAQAYLNVVKTRNATSKIKKNALKKAGNVPLEVSKLCYSAIQMTPFLVKEGNKHLISDVEVAIELLYSAFKSALITYRINQS